MLLPHFLMEILLNFISLRFLLMCWVSGKSLLFILPLQFEILSDSSVAAQWSQGPFGLWASQLDSARVPGAESAAETLLDLKHCFCHFSGQSTGWLQWGEESDWLECSNPREMCIAAQSFALWISCDMQLNLCVIDSFSFQWWRWDPHNVFR